MPHDNDLQSRVNRYLALERDDEATEAECEEFEAWLESLIDTNPSRAWSFVCAVVEAAEAEEELSGLGYSMADLLNRQCSNASFVNEVVRELGVNKRFFRFLVEEVWFDRLESAVRRPLIEAIRPELVRQWLIRQRKLHLEVNAPGSWTYGLLYEICEHEPELAWQITLELVDGQTSDETLAMIAACPMEDIMLFHSEAFIDRVERQAAADPRFKWMLGGVYRVGMSDEIWARFQAVSGPRY